MVEDSRIPNAKRTKSVAWLARYSQILTGLLAQAIFVVACVTLFLMLTDDDQRNKMTPGGTVVMVAGGLLTMIVSVIYMFVTVKVKFSRALDTYLASDDAPSLPIRTDQPLTKPLETLLLTFTAATHKSQAFFFTSATINLVLVFFDESWLHLFFAFLCAFSIIWLMPSVGRLARFIQNALDMKRASEAAS
ncbi:MAG: hypothetical protein L7W43_18960 [Rubripirellula sp.]|nr:hypothetical protein [Rubripirellula sp.]